MSVDDDSGQTQIGDADATTQRRPSEPVDPPPPILVASDPDLAEGCRRWRRCGAIGLDTEFIRTRTFFPKLGLVQIGAPDGSYLIDVLAIEEWGPLIELLEEDSVVKVLHSCGEDFEVLHHFFGTFPRPVFDTQIAATAAGHGYSLGYQRLVMELFGVEPPKGETRSNWLQRPLTASQVSYAGLDVAYLLPIYRQLCEELGALGRTAWIEEEGGKLEVAARSRLDPQQAYLRVKRAGRLSPRETLMLSSLSEWREQEARERDVPRGFVLQDDALIRLVRSRPTSRKRLGEIRGLSAKERKRSGDELLRRIRLVTEIPERDLPPQSRTVSSTPGHSRGRVDKLRAVVQEVAEELDLAPEFLAQRRLIEQLVRAAAGEEGSLPKELDGWRRQVIGEKLLAALASIERGRSSE